MVLAGKTRRWLYPDSTKLRRLSQDTARRRRSIINATGVTTIKNLADYATYILVRVFICIVQSLRIETCHAIAKYLAFVACDIVRLRYKVVDENIKQVFPDWSAKRRHSFARKMWEHLFLMVCEIAHAPRTIHETSWRRYISMPQARQLASILHDPRPTVMVTGHFGNFEISGYLIGMFGFRTYTVARDLDNPYLHRFVKRFRESRGQYILPKQGSAAMLDDVLTSGGTLSLLADQAAGGRGCWVEFFGKPASYHKALALFTLTSNAPMMVIYTRRTDRPMHFEVGATGVADPQVPGEHLSGIESLTQWYNDRLEEVVLKSPEQYWWVHRRWKGEPGRRRRKKKSTSGQHATTAPPKRSAA